MLFSIPNYLEVHFRICLDVFAELRQTTISFVMSARLSLHPQGNNSAPIRQIFMKFDIGLFKKKSVQKLQD
jgi:hypothetical protein